MIKKNNILLIIKKLAFIFIITSNFLPAFGQKFFISKDDSIQAVEALLKAVEYGSKGEPEISLKFFEKSLTIRKKSFGEKHFRLGSTYLGMAIQYKNLHQLDMAFKFYKIAEELYLTNRNVNDSRLADVYTNIGNLYQKKGDLVEAIRYQERAVSIYENIKKHSDRDIANYLDVLYNLASVYYLANREKDALKITQKYINQGTFIQKAKLKILTAKIFETFKQYDKAKILHLELIQSFSEDYSNFNQQLADQFNYYSMTLYNNDQIDSALYYLKRSEEIILNKSHNETDIADIYTLMGRCYQKKSIKATSLGSFQVEKKGNLEMALAYLKKALYSLREVDSKEDISLERLKTSNFPVPNLELLLELGYTYQMLSAILPAVESAKRVEYLEEALFYAGMGSDFAEYLRTTFISESSKIQFTEIQENIFTLGVQVAFELYQLTGQEELAEKAFQNMEKKKAASLFDQLSEMESRSASLIPDSLTEKETRLSTSMTYLRERLFSEMNDGEPDTARIFEFKARIFETEQELNKLRDYLENNFQDYFQTKYAQKPITFDQIRRKIQPGEVVISYSMNMPDTLNEGNLYIFALSKKDRRFLKQPVTEQTIKDIRTVYSVLSSNQFLNSGIREFTSFCSSARRLYKLMVMPLQDMLTEKRLTIIPDGMLSYLPFEALLTQMPDTASIHYYDLPYLVLKYPVTYSYSSRLLYQKASKYPPFNAKTLAFSPAYPAWYRINGDSLYLPAIPGIYDEVKFLDRRLKSQVFSGEEATEKNFREQCGNYDILHLAMHTLINDSLPMLSRLAFFQENRDSINNDGWLTTADIYYLHLRAKMVVLSACRSGGGNLKSGEGIISLARGFFYAGCPSVLMSLWDVEDKSATQIMKNYYRNLRLGKTKDRALQEAKIRYLREADPLTSHPHLWMGMITIGNPESLFHGKEKFFLLVVGIIILYLAFDLIRKNPAGRNPAGK